MLSMGGSFRHEEELSWADHAQFILPGFSFRVITLPLLGHSE